MSGFRIVGARRIAQAFGGIAADLQAARPRHWTREDDFTGALTGALHQHASSLREVGIDIGVFDSDVAEPVTGADLFMTLEARGKRKGAIFQAKDGTTRDELPTNSGLLAQVSQMRAWAKSGAFVILYGDRIEVLHADAVDDAAGVEGVQGEDFDEFVYRFLICEEGVQSLGWLGRDDRVAREMGRHVVRLQLLGQ